jgi:hypothetical protein
MNYATAKLHHKAAEANLEYWRLLMLYLKKKSARNQKRVLEQKILAVRLMREAIERGDRVGSADAH